MHDPFTPTRLIQELSRTQEHHAYGAVHKIGTGSIQRTILNVAPVRGSLIILSPSAVYRLFPKHCYACEIFCGRPDRIERALETGDTAH